MAPTFEQSIAKQLWALVREQHGVISREQLLELGLTRDAIKHRLATGRLHQVHVGVYAVGRPTVTREGRWMAAVLACRPDAVISHSSAAALWGIRRDRPGPIHISAPEQCRRPGIVAHRRHTIDDRIRHGIAVTGPAQTLVDLAAELGRDPLEAAINEADKRDLIDPERLRDSLVDFAGVPGVAMLRMTLDRRTFSMTRSRLERRFKPLAERAGLPKPRTQQIVNGYEVDFYWPDLGLVVETDGLTYHRTPQQQSKALLRDQAHISSGLTPLRFSHAQVRYEPAVVERALGRTRANLLRPTR